MILPHANKPLSRIIYLRRPRLLATLGLVLLLLVGLLLTLSHYRHLHRQEVLAETFTKLGNIKGDVDSIEAGNREVAQEIEILKGALGQLKERLRRSNISITTNTTT